MTDYARIERDFVSRTLVILEQYDQHVMGTVCKENEYDVTMLLNCLMGLLIYPQQHAAQNDREWGNWLTDARVQERGSEWGLPPKNVKNPGGKTVRTKKCSSCRKRLSKYVEFQMEDLTIRQVVRQMRNMVAHIHFGTESTTEDIPKINKLIFHDKKQQNGLYVELPIPDLKTFVHKLAQEALCKMGEAPS